MVITVSALVFDVGGAGLRTGGGHVCAIDFIKVVLVVSVYDYITMITGHDKGIQTVSEICYVAILRGGGLASVRMFEFNVHALNDGAALLLFHFHNNRGSGQSNVQTVALNIEEVHMCGNALRRF